MSGQGRTGHTVRQFDTELDDLRGLVLKMGKLVTQQIRDALEGLLDDKVALAKMVQRREDWVDAMEVEADDRIVDLLVKRQPVGPDLRAILSLGTRLAEPWIARAGPFAPLRLQCRTPGPAVSSGSCARFRSARWRTARCRRFATAARSSVLVLDSGNSGQARWGVDSTLPGRLVGPLPLGRRSFSPAPTRRRSSFRCISPEVRCLSSGLRGGYAASRWASVERGARRVTTWF